ncbi:hypothetical protein ARSEF1564_004245 [Beauveria bassiana]
MRDGPESFNDVMRATRNVATGRLDVGDCFCSNFVSSQVDEGLRSATGPYLTITPYQLSTSPDVLYSVGREPRVYFASSTGIHSAHYNNFRECQNYFIENAQRTGPVQAVAAFLNILLPFQKAQKSEREPSDDTESSARLVELVPYVRRLVATGFDTPAVLHGFFGDGWKAGIGQIHEMERRNFLFAAKSENWVKVKSSYDIEGGQTVPFLRPLQDAIEQEIQGAESSWSEWLAMQDWMIGPRAPPEDGDRGAEPK